MPKGDDLLKIRDEIDSSENIILYQHRIPNEDVQHLEKTKL